VHGCHRFIDSKAINTGQDIFSIEASKPFHNESAASRYAIKGSNMDYFLKKK